MWRSKSISHAVMSPFDPFPRVIVSRGHLWDHMGVPVRSTVVSSAKATNRSSILLLPEEALYLLERGSLQIWFRPNVDIEEAEGKLVETEWDDEAYGVRNAVEMSVQEGYAKFIGMEGLTWEKYQVGT
jgi:tRNA-splicing endonuclease subunit Sen54